MNDGKTLFALILGAAVGSLITWKVVTDKYERILDDIYAEREEDDENEEPIREIHNEAFDEMNREIDEYEAKVAQSGYAAAFDKSAPAAETVEDEATDEEQEGDEEMADLGPRVVSPEEFDDCEYPVVEFSYYSDGFLTDEDDEIVGDIAGTVGKEFVNHFGDYDEDPDTVYVINDADQVCYEILRDSRKYMDVRAQYYDDVEE